MNRFVRAAILGAGSLLAAWTAWGLYTKRSTETVPYERVVSFDGVEVRTYPPTILAKTTAGSQMIAFRRLFDYISGANERRESVSMTAPVRSSDGTSLAMTAPVRTTGTTTESIEMGFYLPDEYDLESAPRPTDGAIELEKVPKRTLAVVSFSWYAGEGRIERYERMLLSTLESRDIEPRGEPVLLRYNDPWTPPWMRTNEIAVEIETE